MERNFNNEFERFLKENADQYRLYPSSKVWNGIYTALHTRRKWFGLGIILLLLTGTLVTLLITNSSKETVIASNKTANEKKLVVPDAQAAVPLAQKRETIYEQNTDIPSVATAKPAQTSISNFYSEPVGNTLEKEMDHSEDDFSTSASPLALGLSLSARSASPKSTNSAFQPKTFEYPKKLAASNPFDWTIESVLNSFSPLSKRNRRFSFQFNFTPTISYRKLSANKSFLRSASLQANTPSSFAALYDINSAVTHKPDMGLEIGFTTRYALASNFRVKAGLQFNVNRYDIKAFNYRMELTTIALRSGGGVDSVQTVSSHRNFNGYKSDWLQNFYFEISMPVGIEVNIAGDDKVQFGIAGTIQPTYILGDRAYLLSTDYKNYAEVPWLIRRWNINTGFETFVSYSTGKMKWQVGPQVRYQLLSSFVDKYPVKENLFDFGLKVGVSLNR